jgi:ATP-binding cassette, subfamily B (MDR/TAP), member 1
MMIAVLYAISQCANFLGNALIFYYGGYLIAYEGYNVKQFFVVFMAVVFGSISAGRIFAFVPDVTRAKYAAEAVLKLIDRVPPIDSDSQDGDNIQKDTVTGNVEFKDVRVCRLLQSCYF